MSQNGLILPETASMSDLSAFITPEELNITENEKLTPRQISLKVRMLLVFVLGTFTALVAGCNKETPKTTDKQTAPTYTEAVKVAPEGISNVQTGIHTLIVDKCNPIPLTQKETDEVEKLHQEKYSKIDELRKKKDEKIEELREKRDREVEALHSREAELGTEYYTHMSQINGDYYDQKRKEENEYYKEKKEIEDAYNGNSVVQKMLNTIQTDDEILNCEINAKLNAKGIAELEELKQRQSQEWGILNAQFSQEWLDLKSKLDTEWVQLKEEGNAAWEQAKTQEERSVALEKSDSKKKQYFDRENTEKAAYFKREVQAKSAYFANERREKRALLEIPEYLK